VKITTTISMRDLSRNTKKLVNRARRGATLVITFRNEPVAVLEPLPDDVALHVLPLSHPRVEAILERYQDSSDDVPAEKVLPQLRHVVSLAKSRRAPTAPGVMSGQVASSPTGPRSTGAGSR